MAASSASRSCRRTIRSRTSRCARYFTDSGFEVVRDIYLRCKSWTAIAEVPPEVLREQLIELNGNGRDVDAIVQVGTNLSMVRLAAAAEMWLGKPVIAINTATYWHALRQNKIMDKIPGSGGCWRNFEAAVGLWNLLGCRRPFGETRHA